MRISKSFISVNIFSFLGALRPLGRNINSKYKQVIASYYAVIVSSYHFNN